MRAVYDHMLIRVEFVSGWLQREVGSLKFDQAHKLWHHLDIPKSQTPRSHVAKPRYREWYRPVAPMVADEVPGLRVFGSGRGM